MSKKNSQKELQSVYERCLSALNVTVGKSLSRPGGKLFSERTFRNRERCMTEKRIEELPSTMIAALLFF